MSAVADDTRPAVPVQVVVAPVSLNLGHSLELSAVALLAVGLQLAYHHRSREVVVCEEHFDPPIRLSEWMEQQPTTDPETRTYKRRSILSALQERTIRS
jgi:hypothetical protein